MTTTLYFLYAKFWAHWAAVWHFSRCKLGCGAPHTWETSKTSNTSKKNAELVQMRFLSDLSGCGAISRVCDTLNTTLTTCVQGRLLVGQRSVATLPKTHSS